MYLIIIRKTIILLLTMITIAASESCEPKERYYTTDDFGKVPKTDAHFHYLTTDSTYIAYAASLNFRLITPVWDGEEVPVAEQMDAAASIRRSYPDHFAYFGTFVAGNPVKTDFVSYTVSSIRDFMKSGASGVKLWKNIGMVLKDSTGRYIMIDDVAFDPMFSFLVREKIPVIAHLGEPKNCWLPLEEMTDPGDALYFRNNPQYHMYLHPEVPSYEEQIKARDNVLKKYPDLDFSGAHLGSLEWSIDELAKRFDSFPNFRVDMAARMFHLQYQSAQDYENVRNFMIRYQDRILYGTDMEVHDQQKIIPLAVCENLRKGWFSHWLYLATDSTVNGIRGLHLPSGVIDKIYYKNADPYFKVR